MQLIRSALSSHRPHQCHTFTPSISYDTSWPSSSRWVWAMRAIPSHKYLKGRTLRASIVGARRNTSHCNFKAREVRTALQVSIKQPGSLCIYIPRSLCSKLVWEHIQIPRALCSNTTCMIQLQWSMRYLLCNVHNGGLTWDAWMMGMSSKSEFQFPIRTMSSIWQRILTMPNKLCPESKQAQAVQNE